MSLGEKLQLGASGRCTPKEHRQMRWALALTFVLFVALSGSVALVGLFWVWAIMTIIGVLPLAFSTYVVTYHARSHRELDARGGQS